MLTDVFLRRIYTTFILGTALLNFGTWANSFEHGPLYLHGKYVFFQCWFLERHPWNKNATLRFLSPCTCMTAVHIISGVLRVRLRCAFGALSWPVQKVNGRFASTKGNCMACFFKKAKASFTVEQRSKVIPCTALICTKAATIRPAASYSGLSKSSTLKRGMDASPFFCVVWHGGSILSWWTVVFQL